MKNEARKAAIAAYKERKADPGIYVVRCTATESVWVGQAPDLNTIQNRIWFTLRNNISNNRSLQEEWLTYGEHTFTFEILELVDGDEHVYLREASLKDRLVYWQNKLNACGTV